MSIFANKIEKMKNISINDILEIIKNDESRTLEVKETTGELAKAMTSACAFLNSDGGWVMFGITPRLKIIGQQVTDNTKKEIANAIRKIEPAVNVAVQYIEIPDKLHLERFCDVLQLHASQSHDCISFL